MFSRFFFGGGGSGIKGKGGVEDNGWFLTYLLVASFNPVLMELH